MADEPMPSQDETDAGIGTGISKGSSTGTGIDNDALEATRILHALSPTGLAALAMLEVVESIDSTNSELLRRDTARDGASVLFAEQQTGGRGRQGRVWVSPPACNLYVSIARHFVGDIARLGGLSLVVGVAVAEELQTLGLDRIRLKWPNDLVIPYGAAADDATANGAHLRKLGGVLIESGGLRDGGVRAVIGLGLNINMSGLLHPALELSDADAAHARIDTIDQPWADLRSQLGARTPSRNAIAVAVLDALLPALAAFERDGLAPTLHRYPRFDALRGQTIETRGGAEPLFGIADGLADDGALRLRTSTGDVLLRAGEISVRPA